MLRMSAEPIQHNLADRLDRCQQARDAKRGWGRLHQMASNGYPYRCRLVSCCACQRSIIRNWQDKARCCFQAAENPACSIVKIVLGHVAEVELLHDLTAMTRKKLGNLRAATDLQPGGWRWRSMRVFGMIEPELFFADDMALPTPDQNTLHSCSPLIQGHAGSWQALARLAVHHPHLDRAALVQGIMQRWRGTRRVDVQLFNEQKSASDNAADMTGNSLQHLDPIRFAQTGWRWPPRWQAEYHLWLFSRMRGLQPISISSQPRPTIFPSPINRKMKTVADILAMSEWRDDGLEPMPIVF
jgi:hypothetical protein